MRNNKFQDYNIEESKNLEVESTVNSNTTFKISEVELRGINRWKDAIKEVYGEYGSYEYRFGIGSGIGYTIKVFSNLTKTEKDFTDYSNW